MPTLADPATISECPPQLSYTNIPTNQGIGERRKMKKTTRSINFSRRTSFGHLYSQNHELSETTIGQPRGLWPVTLLLYNISAAFRPAI